MVDRLRVTELDFDTIKNNLKSFLKQQSTFTDYDFDGSGLSVLIDLLAYNTHYNAYYLNMVANESFLDTALLRDSAVSHAKTLGYTPHSRKAAVATITLIANSAVTKAGTLTLGEGFSFLSDQIDGKSYKVEDIFVNKYGFKIFINPRYNTKNTHGTGCTLSSAITTFFSCGKTIKKACELGIKYVNSAIITNPKYGKGHGPINHLNSMIIKKRFK